MGVTVAFSLYICIINLFSFFPLSLPPPMSVCPLKSLSFVPPFLFSYYMCLFLDRVSSYCVALTILEFRLALNSQKSPCLCLLSAEIRGIHHSFLLRMFVTFFISLKISYSSLMILFLILLPINTNM